MERGDVVVYDVKGKPDYIARFDELGWVQWPAEMGGWQRRRPGRESDVDPSRELEPNLARLALVLSGVRG